MSEVTPEMAPVVAEIVNGPSHHPEVWALKLVVAWLMIGAVVELPALMYVSEVTLGPRTITPVTEATNARKSVAFSDHIASNRRAFFFAA